MGVGQEVEELKGRVGDGEKEFAATQARLAQERTESENATRELGEARSRVENLSQRVTDLDRQLIIQVKEAEMLGNRVNDLEGRLATQGKLLAEREYENNQLKQPNEAADRAAKELRVEIAALSGGSNSPVIEKLRSEKAAVEEQLGIARDERAKLQRDINAIQQQAESSWATERMENALLRERINDIAAEVAKLAMQLEGPNSAIEAMLAAEPAAPKAPPKPANGAAAPVAVPEGGGTLAERIRALQSHASRARQQGAYFLFHVFVFPRFLPQISLRHLLTPDS